MFRAALITLLISATSAFANDSEAEIAVGGLTLKPSTSISLDSEDLYISPDEVRVSYTFTNTSTKDVETLVAFPLPELPTNTEGMIFDYRTRLNFKTEVDGKPVKLDYTEQAFLNGKDVTAVLKTFGLTPALEGDVLSTRINALPTAKREALIMQGFVRDEGMTDQKFWAPLWTVRVSVTRKQKFPAGKSIKVKHRYAPLVGGSVGGTFEPKYRNQPFAQSQIKRYCVEDSWLKAFDRKGKSYGNENGYPASELWISYILKSGANWKGPIKNFRLVIDKAKPNAMVSFCGEGVKKISPTQFEIRQKNFEPKSDIDILIINWRD